MDYLDLLESAVSLTSLAAAAACFTAVAVFTYLRSAVGIVLCLSVLFARVLLPRDPVAASLAGIDLYPVDVVYLTLALVALLRWLHLIGRRGARLEHGMLLLLAILMLVNFVRGVIEHGPQDAGVELRRHFYVISGAAYFASFEPVAKRMNWNLRAWIVASLAICVVSVQRFAIGLASLDLERLRVVDSNVTLVLAQAMLICLYFWVDSKNPRLYRNLALVLLPFVVIMQHRTVWVVLLATVLAILVLESRLRNRLLAVLAIGAVLTGVGVLAIYGDRGSEVLGDSASDTGTFEWRVEGWRVLLDEQLHGVGSVVLGRPLGAGFERYLPQLGYSVDVSPHNYYIEMLLVGGALGLLLLLLIYGRASLRALAKPRWDDRGPGKRVAFVLLLSQLVYYITYAPLPEQSVILGIALSIGLPLSRESVPAQGDPYIDEAVSRERLAS